MKNKILIVFCLLFGLMFINAGLNKFFNYMPVPEDIPEESLKDFQAMMEISWLMPLLATVEIIGGVLFLIPRTRALGSLIILPVMAGILLSHIFVAPEGLIVVIVLAAVLLLAMYEDRDKYAPLFRARSAA